MFQIWWDGKNVQDRKKNVVKSEFFNVPNVFLSEFRRRKLIKSTAGHKNDKFSIRPGFRGTLYNSKHVQYRSNITKRYTVFVLVVPMDCEMQKLFNYVISAIAE